MGAWAKLASRRSAGPAGGRARPGVASPIRSRASPASLDVSIAIVTAWGVDSVGLLLASGDASGVGEGDRVGGDRVGVGVGEGDVVRGEG